MLHLYACLTNVCVTVIVVNAVFMLTASSTKHSLMIYLMICHPSVCPSRLHTYCDWPGAACDAPSVLFSPSV